MLMTRWNHPDVEANGETNGEANGETKAESGFTMVELAVVLAILSLVSVMSMSILIATQNVTKAIGWQAEANTELRRLLDDTFAELETARSPSFCLEDGASTYSRIVNVDSTGTPCPKIIDGVDPLAPELLPADRDLAGASLTSAGEHHACYYTHRVDPAFLGRESGASVVSNLTQAGTATYQEVCLLVFGNSLYLVKWPLNTADMNSRPTGAVPRLLGTIDGPSVNFTFFARGSDTDDVTASDSSSFNLVPSSSAGYESTSLDPADYGLDGVPIEEQALAAVDRSRAARVRLNVVVETGTGARRRTRNVDYQVSLRGAAYEAERCWNGKKVAVTVPSDANRVVLTCENPT